ncbi:MAG: FKBP-type peptidyl-prolyl cis-trans isomerase [Lachnospiraceae bacterium]|nr:FKBP-type peptidyl-prolyl cis-trans isomerase [Lachnospiraceae bacterium]
MKKKFYAVLAVLLVLFTVAGCKQSGEYSLANENLSKYMTLGEYKDLTVKYNIDVVTDELIAKQMNSYIINAKDKAPKITEGEAKDGDLVNIDYVGYLDGVAFENGSAKDQIVEIGSETYIPGFEEAIIGLACGETVDANLKFPTEYKTAELAGKDVVFSITLNYIVPGPSDEVAAAIGEGNYSTLAEMKEYARTNLQTAFDSNNRNAILSIAMSQIIDSSEIKSIPEKLKQEQHRELEVKYAGALQAGATSIDEVTKYFYNCSADELVDKFCKQRMVIQMIANEEGLTVTDEVLDERLKQAADYAQVTPEAYLEKNGISRESFRELLTGDVVKDYLYENIKVEPVSK